MRTSVAGLLGVILSAHMSLVASTLQEANETLDRGEFLAAAKAFEEAGPTTPKRREAWRLNNWGLAFIRAEKPSLALPLLEQAVVADPKNGTAWGNLATAYEHVGDRSKALETFRRAIQTLRATEGSQISATAEVEDRGAPAFIQPDCVLSADALKVALGAASKLMDEGKFQEAAKAYEELGRTRPAKREGWKLNNWALALMNLDQHDLARARLELSVKLHPGNPVAWNNLGVVYQKLGLLRSARHAYGRAVATGGGAFDTQRAELNQVKIDYQALRRGPESGNEP